MTSNDIREHLIKIAGAVTFEYNGKCCGIDPFRANEFEMWYGDKNRTVHSINEVMTVKFFNGNSLEDIFDEISDIFY